MKILKWLAIGLVGFVLLLGAVGLMLPDTARMERTTTIAAKPATVYAVLNGFKQFNKWSPWEGLDPNVKQTITGPLVGVGARQAWESADPNVGSGSQEIIATEPDKSIRLKLVFAGFDSDNTATYLLTPEGDGTKLVWRYDSHFKGHIVGRYFGLLLDSMLGPDYEKGLASLKTLVEALPKADFSGLELTVVETTALPILYVSDSGSAAESGAKLGAAYGLVMGLMQANGLKESAMPLAITRKFDEQTKFWEFDAAIAVDKPDFAPPADSPVKAGKTYAGWAIRATHTGPYEAMEPTYEKLLAFKAAAGFDDNGNSWEHYITDPGNTPPEQLKTHVYWPVR